MKKRNPVCRDSPHAFLQHTIVVKCMINVSVIIPIFNNEAYLCRCIESVLAQSLPEIEIILASNGPRKCDEICERYAAKDGRILLIKNSGSYSDSLNTGMRLARGEYIGFVDSDDWIAPTMYETLYRAAVNYDADICKSAFECCFENPSQNYCLYTDIPEGPFHLSSKPEILSYQPSIWSGIYKKEFLQKNSLHFLPGKTSYTDSPFQLEAFLRAQRIFFVNKLLYFYNMSNPNQTVKSTKNVLDGIISDAYLLQRISIKDLPENIYQGLLLALLRHTVWHFGRLRCHADRAKFWHAAHALLRHARRPSCKTSHLSLPQQVFFLFLTKIKYYWLVAIPILLFSKAKVVKTKVSKKFFHVACL